MESDDKLDDKMAKQLEKDYMISNTKSLITKIKLIKQLEGLFSIKFLEIDTNKYVENFDNDIIIGNKIQNTIKNVFRSFKNHNDNTKYKYWYYQLIQMYKNILGNVFFIKKYTRRRNHNLTLMIYTINNDIIDTHKSIIIQNKKSNTVPKNLFKN